MTEKREKELWEQQLLVTATGAPKALLANAITALKHAPGWFRCLAFDVFSRRVMIIQDPPINTKQLNWQPRAWTPDVLVCFRKVEDVEYSVLVRKAT